MGIIRSGAYAPLKGEEMRVEVTRTAYEDKITMGDTISIFDKDEREITVKRGQLHALIEALKSIEWRGKGASSSV